MKTFGETIRDARKLKGFTYERLARAIRSHKGYVNSIEHGNVSPPSPKMIRRLSKILDLDADHMTAMAYLEKRPKALTIRMIFHECASFIEAENIDAANKAQASSAVKATKGGGR